MQVRKLLQDDDAVSPVIGVILMVAITVILAAVIAAFVLGLGGSDNVAPQTSFDYDFDDTDDDGADLTITVQSGDSFQAGNVGFGIDDEFDELDSWADEAGVDDSESIGAGDQVELRLGHGENGEQDFDLNIVWESSDGDDSSIIGGTSGTVTDDSGA